jgi:2-polyprenyl-6-hydroxyphenyl methylase/3-demethylubiquinone-9 3-methyltransferase
MIRNGLSGSLFSKWNSYHKERGMSPWRDVVDWVGGYPFEVAKTEDIISFFEDKGFEVLNLKSVGVGLGCNEYVFRKI